MAALKAAAAALVLLVATAAQAQPPTREGYGADPDAAVVRDSTAQEEPHLVVTTGSNGPVLGIDHEIDVAVELVGPGRLEEAAVHVNVGRVDDVVAGEDGRSLRFRYVLPSERFPQVALLAARARVGSHTVRGLGIVRLRAAASPAFRTDPGALVTLRVGDKVFGPVRAEGDGHVRIPVVVPPGVGFGIARSENRFGAFTEQAVDLKLPSFRRVLVVAPDAATAGAPVEVVVHAVEPSGIAAPPTAVRLETAKGGTRPQPLGGAPGIARFLVHAPTAVDAAPVELRATVTGPADGGHEATASLRAKPAAPARLVLRPDRSRLEVGGAAALGLVVSAEDAFGNRTDAEPAQLYVDGTKVDATARESGRATFVVPPPPARPRPETLALEVVLGGVYTRHDVPLEGVPRPARPVPVVAARARPDDRRPGLSARLGAAFSSREALGPSVFVEGLTSLSPLPRALGVGLALGFLQDSAALVADDAALSRLRLRLVPLLAFARWRVRPRRSFELAAGAGAGIALASSRLEALGQTVRGHTVAPAFETGAEAALAAGPGELLAGLRWLYVAVGELSSGDVVRGNGAGFIADAGYRMRW